MSKNTKNNLSADIILEWSFKIEIKSRPLSNMW
jgi:hypothetical protein